MRLEGKSALITGAARGIGRAFAEAYIKEGARVAIGDIDLAGAQRTAEQLGSLASAVHLDVTDQGSIDKAVQSLEQSAGGIDILINNAALFDLAPIVEITTCELRQAVCGQCRRRAVHAAGRRQIDDRPRQGRQDHQHGEPGRPPRRGAGCGVLRDQGSGHQPHPVGRARPHQASHQRQCDRPGVVDGEHWDHVDALFAKYENLKPGEKKKLVGEAVPYGRMGTAADLVGMAVFLASADSDYVVAQTYNVDGGNWMS